MRLPADDLLNRFEVVLDENSEAVDWDDVLADFLLACAGCEPSTLAGSPETDEVVETEADQRQEDEEPVAKRQGCDRMSEPDE